MYLQNIFIDDEADEDSEDGCDNEEDENDISIEEKSNLQLHLESSDEEEGKETRVECKNSLRCELLSENKNSTP